MTLSFTNARRRLLAWFHKPPDTMFDAWGAIVDRYVLQPVAHFLFYFTQAASQSPSPTLILDRLSVSWIWLNKHVESPEHEYLIIETVDSVDETTRLFVLDRTIAPPEPKDTTSTKDGSKRPDTSAYQRLGNFQGISDLIQSSISPSHATTSLSAMEEGLSASASTSTPISYPPVSHRPSHHSIKDTITLSATKSTQILSDSLNKRDKLPALDQIRGESAALSPWYSLGKNTQQIKPRNLMFFEFIILAHTVHLFAPDYSHTRWNCYWFANMLIDTIIGLFGLKEEDTLPEDETRKEQYKSLDSHLAQASGCWNGQKIIQTDIKELSKVVYAFKKEHVKAVAKVKNSSSKFLFLTKFWTYFSSYQWSAKGGHIW